jgi:cold-inducible RNA-binding protein
MARVRSREPDDLHTDTGSRKTPGAHTSGLREDEVSNPSVILTTQNPSSLHTLQRTVGNRAVVDMIASGRAKPSVQREGEPAARSGGRTGNRLYVGNLAFGTSQQTVQEAFAAVGQVREVSMPTDRETGQPRGFAFVTMGNGQDAQAAIAQLNGAVLDGRPLRVNEAQERQTGGRGGGGGGFGGGGGGGGGGRRGGGGGRDRY